MSAYNSASSQAPPTTSVSDFLKPASAPAQPTTSDAYSKLCKVSKILHFSSHRLG